MHSMNCGRWYDWNGNTRKRMKHEMALRTKELTAHTAFGLDSVGCPLDSARPKILLSNLNRLNISNNVLATPAIPAFAAAVVLVNRDKCVMRRQQALVGDFEESAVLSIKRGMNPCSVPPLLLLAAEVDGWWLMCGRLETAQMVTTAVNRFVSHAKEAIHELQLVVTDGKTLLGVDLE
ncbi:hypothetical protein BCR44DRAFT_359975 [Catenaria anguillulae PL171]|uniref:Uncharacterized protein n=1 Tax=Catenaria anguillulae PL171 TaxID=765915 RepID=A0A1Y2I0V5_9FUNG|nr:hypothetical protein BCR44DRAFT_359975 [Catenaria anguillulae PL171]